MTVGIIVSIYGKNSHRDVQTEIAVDVLTMIKNFFEKCAWLNRIRHLAFYNCSPSYLDLSVISYLLANFSEMNTL
jgi:hypothetical protein